MEGKHFPDGFLWGAATASYQIEGASADDNKGESIWDRFTHTPGKIARGENGDVACDHYHRWQEDVDLMAGLGLGSYRFSVSWPRIFPGGRGPAEPRGVDFYRRLVDRLNEKGIVPAVTLYHWDLPQALQSEGGWANRDTAYRFADYAAFMFEKLGPAVPMWITHNEPFVAAFMGHAIGEHAPGNHSPFRAVRVSHHLLLSHGLAVQAFRQAGLGDARIGITHFLWPQEPATPKRRDVEAACRMDGIINRWFLDPVFRGSYPPDIWQWYVSRLCRPPVKDGDLAVISTPSDFLGVNYYSRMVHRASLNPLTGAAEVKKPAGRTEMGWEIYSDGLYSLLVRLYREYGPLPLFVTENGIACRDTPALDGSVEDDDRIAYLRDHLAACLKAVHDGVDLRGYYVWSLMDNFEWALGYEKRFGLFRVDFSTGRRFWKKSAHWYQKVIAENAVE